jgi:Ku70/Ku80 beta-barrel domain
MSIGTSNVLVAQKTNDKAVMALSSLIHALFELDSYAVARVVKKDGSDPLLTLLSPSVEQDYECLIENQLPFNEDVRSYRFPPIDKIVTVSGKVLTQHRHLPSKDLIQAMSDFVDRMDLSHFDRNEESGAGEYMSLGDAFSPVLHRIEQAKRWRAVRPMEPIPPVPEVLLKYSQPPEQLQQDAQPALQRLLQAADVKKGKPTPYSLPNTKDITNSKLTLFCHFPRIQSPLELKAANATAKPTSPSQASTSTPSSTPTKPAPNAPRSARKTPSPNSSSGSRAPRPSTTSKPRSARWRRSWRRASATALATRIMRAWWRSWG